MNKLQKQNKIAENKKLIQDKIDEIQMLLVIYSEYVYAPILSIRLTSFMSLTYKQQLEALRLHALNTDEILRKLEEYEVYRDSLLDI